MLKGTVRQDSRARVREFQGATMKRNHLVLVAAAVLAALTTPAFGSDFKIEEATIPQLEQALRDHRITCHALVQAYLDRIAAYNKQGPKLDAILALNPNALATADRLDAAYVKTSRVGPLYCVPVVLKDNYNTADLPTTGGSLSLEGTQPARDAFVVARLRAAGAIILAKTNMHEFALAGTTVSSLGGQTLNPYDLTHTPGGSSGGTGAALAANLAMAGTGSDTVNSVRSPASANALVGLRPTHGLLSLTGIMPVSSTQDAIGPLGRHVVDVASMLQTMAVPDPADPATQGHPHPNYVASLRVDALKGARIGVLRVMFGSGPEHQPVNAVMEQALTDMKKAGATLVDVDAPELDSDKLIARNDVQKYEFVTVMDRYLASTMPQGQSKTVEQIYASGKFDHATLGSFLKAALASKDGMAQPDYKLRIERDAQTRALLTRIMADNHLDAIVYPLQKRLVVPLTETNQVDRNGILASVTGFPAITVPAGFSAPTATAPIGLPVGMDILGKPWHEAQLLSIAYSFERATHFRRPPESTPPLASEQ